MVSWLGVWSMGRRVSRLVCGWLEDWLVGRSIVRLCGRVFHIIGRSVFHLGSGWVGCLMALAVS
jgi:hypothetical protein